MTQTLLIAASGAGAHLALALLLARDGTSPARVLAALSAILGLVGVAFGWMSLAADAQTAALRFFFVRHGLFAVPALFLLFALAATGRRLRTAAPAFVWYVVLIVCLYVDRVLGANWLIAGMEARPWGYYPVAGPGARLLFLPYLVLCALAGIVLLWRPTGLPKVGARPSGAQRAFLGRVALLFVVWWVGLAFNLGALLGWGLPPIGFVVDAVVFSVIAGLAARQRHQNRRHPLFQIAVVCVGLSAAFLAMGSLLTFSLPGDLGALLLGTVCGVSAAGAVLWALGPQRTSGEDQETPGSARPLFTRLQTEYGLTYQQAKICCEFAEGRSRPEVRRRLGITDGTLRNHLSVIYEILLADEHESKGSKDRLQRLTVALRALG